MFESLKFWKKKEPAVAASVDTAEPQKSPGIAPPEHPPSAFAEKKPVPRARFPSMPGEEQGMGMPSSGLGPEQAPGFRRNMRRLEAPQPPEVQADLDSNKDFQLVNAKLDAIKAGIDHINSRLDRLEKPKEEKEIIAWR